MEDVNIKKFGTFPKKPTQLKPMSNHKFNKFQRVAALHKEQEKNDGFVHRKLHFGGTPRLAYREGGEKYKKPAESDDLKTARNAKSLKNLKGNKRNQKEHGGKLKNSKNKKTKGEPVKGTSTEYHELANSDDDDDVIDVSDMIPKDEDEDKMESEIPLINTTSKVGKVKKTAGATKFATKNRFNALGEYEAIEEGEEEVPRKKQKIEEDSDEVREDVGGDSEPEAPEEEEDDDEEDDDDEEERLKFREEIAQMPLGKVREMKEKLGIKLFNKTYFGESANEKKRKEAKKVAAKEASKKDGGQHRPREMSSKRPVSAFRNIYGEHEQQAKKKRWDPRFDSRAGDFKEVCFENNYQFLDEIRDGEMQDLRNEYQTARTEGDEKTASRLKNTLQKMETREKTRAEKRRQAETRKELHDENIQRMLRGEAPIFRTKAQVRRIDAEKKYEELKKDNKLDKYLQRKAKKESAKQKKSRPPFEGFGYQ